MRRSLLLAAAAFLLVAAAILGYRWHQRDLTAARRLAAFQAQQEEDAAHALLDRMIALDGRETTLEQFADLIATASTLSVELDEIGIQKQFGKASLVQLPKGNFSLRAALAIVLQPRGLWADVRGRRLVITTRENSIDLTSLRTAVYPLPQPEPGGMDDQIWSDVIRINVDPGTWDEVGGKGHIETVPGALVIVQTSYAHRRIRHVIDTLAGLDDTTSGPLELPPPSPGSVESQILAALDSPTTMEFVEQPLRDAVQYLAQQHHIPIVLLTHKLLEAAVSTDIPITKNLNGISLRAGLRLLLNDLELTFLIRNEALIITTPEDAESHLRTVVYPVEDLVSLSAPAATDFDSLIDLITVCVSPQSWDVSGPSPLLGISNRWLLVQQTDYVHEEIQHLLAQLRHILFANDPLRSAPVFPKDEGTRKIHSALDKTLQLRFTNAPLRDVVDSIQQQLGIPIVLAANKLEEAAVSPDTPITCDWPPGRASFLLQLLLEPLDLTYVVRDEVLQITTPEDAESQLIYRIYDLRPLLAASFTGSSISILITNVVAPNSWDTVGGPGTAQLFRGLLVVAQTEDVHRKIELLLAAVETHCVPQSSASLHAGRIMPIKPNQARDQIEKQLATLVHVEFQDMPLQSALKQLATDHSLPLAFDRQVLDLPDFERLPSVTLSTDKMTLGGVLNRLLRPQGLACTVREHLLWISTANRSDIAFEDRLYEVSDLAAKDPNAVSLVVDQMLNELTLLGVPIVQPVNKDWLLVSAPSVVHERVADWLTEYRTGMLPQREAERRALELDLRRKSPARNVP